MTLSLLFPPSMGMAKATARAELVEPELSDALGQPVQVEVTKTYAELEARAMAGEAHLVWAPSGVCARIEPSSPAVFKVVRNGMSTYRAAIIARRSCGATLADLKGLVAAWVDPLSVGGYLLAMGHLRELGVYPEKVFRSQLFLGSHPAVLHALLTGTADITAITIQRPDRVSILATLASHIGPHLDKFDILAVTDEAPTDALVLTQKLTATEVARVKKLLAPPGYDVRLPGRLLAAMEADTLVLARHGEYAQVLRLIRGVRR